MLYNDGFSHSNITAAGTTTLTSGRKSVLHAVSIGQPFVGTVTFKDGDTTILTVGTPSVIPQTILFDARTKDSLTAVATGTPTLTVMYK